VTEKHIHDPDFTDRLHPIMAVNQHYWANISCNQPIKRKKVMLNSGENTVSVGPEGKKREK